MKFRSLAVGLAAIVLTTGVAGAQDMTSEKGKLSYYFGYAFARDLAESGEPVDTATIVRAVQDGLAKKEPAIAPDALRPAVEAFQRRQQAKAAEQKAKWDKLAQDNQALSTTFMTQARSAAGAKVLPSGVVYKVIEPGAGAKPTAASTVDLQVGGPFPLGQRPPQVQVQQMPNMKLTQIEMAAIREVLMQMPAGARWEVTLPPDKAFGNNPASGFPPNVAVVFDIKLVAVK